MPSYLEPILEGKKREIDHLKRSIPSLQKALQGETLTVIAEIKRCSPSKGIIGSIDDPVILAKKYIEGGASALSVLTEEVHFKGNLSDLRKVSMEFNEIPVLRKDFIIDPLQIKEAKFAGASAVLLIVSLLKEKTSLFLKEVEALGLEALVEVHNREELQIALEAGAQIIGINNRNLETFVVDLSVAESLAPMIPRSIVKVAESGIRTREDALRMRRAGFDAVLIGEALVKSANPIPLIKEIRQ